MNYDKALFGQAPQTTTTWSWKTMHLLRQAIWGLWFNWCKCEKPEENKWQCHKIKQMQPMSPLEKAIWGDIWKRTVEKNEINANNVTLDLLRWAIWVNISKCTAEKNQTNSTNATISPVGKTFWGNIWKRTTAVTLISCFVLSN